MTQQHAWQPALLLQILGERARARVPAEFVTQSLDAANPPTLFLVLVDIGAALSQAPAEQDAEDLQFLQAGAAPALGCPCPASRLQGGLEVQGGPVWGAGVVCHQQATLQRRAESGCS